MNVDDSFTRFVEEHSADLMRIALHLTGNHHAAADLTQSALEQAYRRWSRVTDAEDPYAYVRKILVNKQRDGWRLLRRRREEPTSDATVVSDGERVLVDRNDPSSQWQRRQELRQLLATLTPKERAVIVLRFLEDRSEVDTANELDIAVGTVKSTTARALAKLRVSDHVLQEIS